MRRAARTAVLPAVLTVLAVASQYLPTVTLARDSVPAWLPRLGPPALTAAVYRETLLALGTLAALAGALALGYREARHRDVGRAYLRYVGVVCAAGATAMLLVFAGSVVAGGSTGSSPFLALLTVSGLLVAVPGVLTVAALAGVALASTRADESRTLPARELLPLGLGVGAVTAVGYALDSAGDLAAATSDAVGVPASFPQFGTVGTTAVTYFQTGRLAGDLALVGGGVALGAFAVRRTEAAAPSRRFVAAATTGALGGLLAAWTPVTWYVTAGSPEPSGRPLASAAASLPNAVASTAAVAVLAAVAGAGVARFEADGAGAGESESADAPISMR